MLLYYFYSIVVILLGGDVIVLLEIFNMVFMRGNFVLVFYNFECENLKDDESFVISLGEEFEGIDEEVFGCL